MSKSEVYSRLVVDEPPPTDIFRVYRANHPETLAFDPPVRVEKAQPDFSPETSITLRSGEKPTEQNSVLPVLVGAAAVSAATKQINAVVDINDLLKDGNWEGAEDILGRPLTLEEKQQRQILDAVASPPEKAAQELKREKLKEKLKKYQERYKKLREKWKQASDKAAKARYKELMDKMKAGAAIAAMALQDDLLFGGWDSEDDDDDADAAANVPLPDSDEDDTASLAPTRRDDDTESIASTRVLGQRPGNVREMDEDRKELDLSHPPPMMGSYYDVEHPWIDPFVKQRAPYEERAKMLYEKYPEQAKELKKYKTLNINSLSVYIPIVETRLKKLADEERARRAANLNKPEKSAGELVMEAEELLNESPLGLGSPLPLGGQGLKQKPELFTGLRRPKNPQDWVAFGRMAIDLKKLKASGQFSLLYPASGQKNTLIRNAVLTPALKECILAYLGGEPMNTMDLTQEESDWLKFVWQNAGLVKKTPSLRILKNRTKPEVLARIKVLIGEIAAGNDSEDIPVELGKLLDHAQGKRWMSVADLIKIRRMISD